MRSWLLGALLGLGLVLGLPAGILALEETPRAEGSSLAAPVRAPRLPLPPVTRVALSNGMLLLLQEAPGDPIVAVELLVKVGVQEEGSNLAGVTRLIQEILSERISRGEDGEDLVEFTGSLLSTTAEADYARVSLTTTPEHLSLLLGRLGEALRARSCSPAELEKVRDRVLQELQGNRGAFSALYEIFLDHFYRYHPYKRTGLGSEGSLRRLDLERLDRFFARYFVPNRMVLSISGAFESGQVEAQVREEFGALTPVRDTRVSIQWEPQSSEKTVNLSGGSRLAWLLLGFPAPGVTSPDYPAMQVVQGVLGEGLSSRLWTELREKNGLAYELGSVYPGLEGPSHVLAYIVTQPERIGESRRRIVEQVDRLKREGISALELEETQRKLIGNYLLARETNRGKAFHLALAEILGLGHQADLAFIKQISGVTPNQVKQAARRYLEQPTLIVARPGGRFYFDF